MMEVLVHRAFLPEAQRDESRAVAGAAKLEKPAAVLDAHLAARAWMVGDRFSVADLNVHSVLGWAAKARVEFPKLPHLTRWLEVCRARPARGRVFKR
jgi:glutathione S-transferase